MAMKYRTLGNTGLEVSILSFGASSIGSVFRSTNDEEAVQVVHKALESGINYIDTAPWYGHGKAELMLGKALKDIPREKYFLSTKVGRYLPEVQNQFDFTAERTIRSVDESLQRMGVNYVDVIQVHDPEFAPDLDIIINETLPALQTVKESGKARFIGLTGYPLSVVKTLLERSPVHIDTVLTYCHYSMNDSSLLDYLPFFKEKGVGVVNASPISMGLLSNRGPPDWHPSTPEIRDACKKAATYCQEKGVDIAKIAMHYTLSNTDVTTTLFSTASMVNLEHNLKAVNEELTHQEKQVLEEVMERFMKPLNNKTWEGVEVKQYWENMKKAGF